MEVSFPQYFAFLCSCTSISFGVDESSNAYYICYCAAGEIAALSSRTLQMKQRNLLHYGTSIAPSEMNDGLIEILLCPAAINEKDCIIILHLRFKLSVAYKKEGKAVQPVNAMCKRVGK